MDSQRRERIEVNDTIENEMRIALLREMNGIFPFLFLLTFFCYPFTHLQIYCIIN